MLHSLQTDTWTVLGLGGIVLTMLLIIKNLKAAKHHLPPSPPGDPIIGNLRHVPLEHSLDYVLELEASSRWAIFRAPTLLAKMQLISHLLGTIFHLNVFGRLVFVINSPSIARELLDTKGANTSD